MLKAWASPTRQKLERATGKAGPPPELLGFLFAEAPQSLGRREPRPSLFQSVLAHAVSANRVAKEAEDENAKRAERGGRASGRQHESEDEDERDQPERGQRAVWESELGESELGEHVKAGPHRPRTKISLETASRSRVAASPRPPAASIAPRRAPGRGPPPRKVRIARLPALRTQAVMTKNPFSGREPWGSGQHTASAGAIRR